MTQFLTANPHRKWLPLPEGCQQQGKTFTTKRVRDSSMVSPCQLFAASDKQSRFTFFDATRQNIVRWAERF
jgi:hypothetical protein